MKYVLYNTLQTSLPVGTCLASFTFAKFPLPIVLMSLYFPIWGSSLALDLEEDNLDMDAEVGFSSEP